MLESEKRFQTSSFYLLSWDAVGGQEKPYSWSMCFFSALKNPFIEEGVKKWNFKICVFDERKFVYA